MNSYPYQRNYTPSTQYYHPSWEAVPSQMKEDPPNSTWTHETWPHNYGYQVPMQSHNCCTHGQHPGYYNFRPPCSHFPPPPPPPYHHFYGGYPPYPQPYPMYYGPPPQYPMEIPRYEYDRNVPRDQFHCCGCLNHPHRVKGGSNVTIEEHEPDAEKKKSESPSPTRVNNFPYPIMWIPPEYTNAMNKEQPNRLIENEADQQQDLPYVKKPQVQQKPVETEVQENEGASLGRKPNQFVQSAEQDPNVNYGWFPLDINRIKQLMEGGDAKQTRDQVNRSKDEKKASDENKASDVGNKDENKHPSFPFFWLPCDGREKGSLKDQAENTTDNAFDGPPITVHPRKIEHADNEAEKQGTAGVDDSRIGTTRADKKKIVKTIPVKQLDDSAPKVSKKEEEHKDTAKNATSAQSSSTTKKPKLPPICLRIDPPKKKKSNDSLTSPSPPGDKKQQDSEESSLKKKSEQPHKEINIKDEEKKTLSHGAEVNKKGSENLKDNATNAEENVVQDSRAEAQEPQATKQSCHESKQERKVMTEMEAAVAIQTAYRGHHVRRSEPIKKLKQIAKVHEEVIQVRKHLEDLESRVAVDVKEKTAIGETIMSLLLKLDSMQGLHQSIRDVRKSVAKELISLQEKLDSITSQQSVVSAPDISTTPAVEEPPRDSDAVDGSEVVIVSVGQPNKESSLDGDKNTKIAEVKIFSSGDLSSNQPLPCQDGVSCYENSETYDASVVNTESQGIPSNDTVVSAARSVGDVAPANLDLKINEEADAREAVPTKSTTEFQNQVADTGSIEDTTAPNQLELGNKSVVSALPQEVDIAVENDRSIVNKSQEGNLLTELPQGVDDKSFTNVSISEDALVENDMVVGNQNCNSNISTELPRDVEEDELAEKPQEGADYLSKLEKETQEDFPPEVINDDGKVQTGVENSSNLNKDEVDQPTEKQEVKSEDMMAVEKENYKHLELPSLEAVRGQEAESTSGPTNMEITEEASEISIVADVSELESKSDNVKQEHSVETLVPELNVQQSKDEDGALRLPLGGQSSAAAHEMDEQADKKIIEENEKLRVMLEKLLAAEKEQQEVISNLNGKVKDLEKKLGSSRKKKSAKHPKVRISRRLCGKSDCNSVRESTMGIAS